MWSQVKYVATGKGDEFLLRIPEDQLIDIERRRVLLFLYDAACSIQINNVLLTSLLIHFYAP